MVNPAQVSSTGVAPTLPGAQLTDAQLRASMGAGDNPVSNANFQTNVAQPTAPAANITQSDPLGSDPAKVQEAAKAMREREAAQSGEMKQAYGQVAPIPPRPTEADYAIHPERAQAFLPLMMALSALAGSRTATPMAGAIQNMNAVMKAQLAGDKEMTQQHMQAMWDNYNAAMAEHKQQMTEVEKKMPMYLTDPKAHGEDMRLWLVENYGSQVANSLMLDPKNIIQHIDSQAKLSEKADEHKDNIQQKELDRKAREDIAHSNQMQTPLSPDSIAYQIKLAQASGKVQDAYVGIGYRNEVAKGQIREALARSGITGGEMQESKINIAAETGAAKQAENRAVAVKRLGESFSALEPKLKELAAKGLAGGVHASNVPINELRKQLSDVDLVKLKTLMSDLGTQYMEASTMPGSNAQMHEGARVRGQELLNENMTLGELLGSYQTMKDILASNQTVLDRISGEEASKANKGGTSAPAGGGKVMSLDAWLKSQGQ